ELFSGKPKALALSRAGAFGLPLNEVGIHMLNSRFIRLVFAVVCAMILAAPAFAQKKKPAPSINPSEDEYYPIRRYEFPPGEVIEPGAIEIMPDGKIAVGTRRGEIWLVDHAYSDDPKQAKFTRFAHGLHEILGLAQKD